MKQLHSFGIGGLVVHPTQTRISEIRDHLANIPIFENFLSEVDAALSIMEHCYLWLPSEIGSLLGNAALRHNDAIYQVVSHYGGGLLPAQFRSHSYIDSATDMQAIAAFALANALLALSSLVDDLQSAKGQEIPALEHYRMHLGCIEECVSAASALLEPEQCEACLHIGELAGAASKRVDSKIDGILSGITRRKETADRDRAIVSKALELCKAGTQFHNLNSKLREWQRRETGRSLSKVQMGEILGRAGLSLSIGTVHQLKK